MTPAPDVYVQYKFYLDVVVLFGVLGNTGYTWWSNREKVTSQRFSALEKEVAERIKPADLKTAKTERDKLCALHKEDRDKNCTSHKAQTSAIEQAYKELQREVSHLPDHNEITELSRTMKELTEKIGNLDGRMSGVNRAVDLMNEFLINQGGKH